MGSRFRGYIEPGAMPPLHRYFGTPVTTCDPERHLRQPLLRHPLRHARHHPGRARADGPAVAVLGVRLRDGAQVGAHAPAHRGGARSASSRIAKGGSATTSASGWFSPWQAAWINLRAMFVYGADFFLFKPGLLLLALGLLLTLPLSFGPVTLGPITFSLHWMLLGLSLAIARPAVRLHGRSCRRCSSTTTARRPRRWFRRFPYKRTVALSARLFGVGLVLRRPADRQLRPQRLPAARRLDGQPPGRDRHRCSRCCGFMTFTFTLLLHSTAVAVRRRGDERCAHARLPAERAAGPSVDRFGVWLSARQIRRHVPSFAGKRVGDFGCGFQAAFARTIARPRSPALVLVDVALAARSQGHPRVQAIEGRLPDAWRRCPTAQPRRRPDRLGARARLGRAAGLLAEVAAPAAPGGVALVNVPSWRGKKFLELSAFRLGLSPAERDGRPQDVLRRARPLAAAGRRRLPAAAASAASRTSSASTPSPRAGRTGRRCSGARPTGSTCSGPR